MIFTREMKALCRKGNESFCPVREIKTKEKIVMKDMEVVKVYNLVNSKGNRLQLELGVGNLHDEEYPLDSKDNGYRWRFFGTIIPMPVRSAYWFNGFPENVMLDWLKGNGWFVQTKVNMRTGYAQVYELPKGDDNSKGNEIPAHVIDGGEAAVKEAIKLLCDNGRPLKAVQLYRYVCKPYCSLKEAKDAVDAIRFDKQP